ncbi:MAG: hypothetical protein ACRCT7_08845 [Shewanella sp.]
MVTFTSANSSGQLFKASPMKLVLAVLLLVATFAVTMVALPLLLLIGAVAMIAINLAWRRLQKRQQAFYAQSETYTEQMDSDQSHPFDDNFIPKQHEAQIVDLPSNEWQRKD